MEWLFHRPAEELYDLDNDPFETKNLADDPALGEVKTRLGKALDAWMAQQNDRGMETELKALSRQPKNLAAAEDRPLPKAQKKNRWLGSCEGLDLRYRRGRQHRPGTVEREAAAAAGMAGVNGDVPEQNLTAVPR